MATARILYCTSLGEVCVVFFSVKLESRLQEYEYHYFRVLCELLYRLLIKLLVHLLLLYLVYVHSIITISVLIV